ncbi:hypothetical protein ACFVX9_30295 [Kitasatospora sp. NPDC058243]|uniref:hypothetical protein n=1 Tax=Kitasatospora sp. NPDC058243 TaxID=3346397 RepID=UPI0036DC7543
MPQVPYDILDRIRDMEQQVRDLYGRIGQRPAMNQIQAGDVVVGQGGTFKVNDTNGSPLFYVGKISPDQPNGAEQRGVQITRQDGTQAIYLARATLSQSDPQAVIIKDARGQTIYAEDVRAGGLAAPVFGADAWLGATEVPQWTTTSSGWSTCMSLPWRKQHPQVQAHYLARCSDGSTAGDIRIIDGAGLEVARANLGAGSYVVSYMTGPVSGAHLGVQYLELQARVTAGSGNVGVRGLSTFGVGS